MSFQTSRHFSAPPAAVFAAFADPLRLARWWGPKDFTNTIASCDFVPGGRWKFTMHGPNGSDYPQESEFAEIVPDSRIVIRHLSKPRYRLTISLAPAGSGTVVSWVQAFDDPRFEPAMRHIIEPANEQNLDRLAAELERGRGGA